LGFGKKMRTIKVEEFEEFEEEYKPDEFADKLAETIKIEKRLKIAKDLF